jgi:hypothetical protein
MKIILVLLFLLTLTDLICQNSQPTEPCSLNVIRQMKAETTEVTILRFLRSYSRNCENDAEFSPAANWHLFYILDRYPQLTINTLTKAQSELNYPVDYILEILKHPVSDDINLGEIIDKIGVLPDSELKRKILVNLAFQTKSENKNGE